jgi:hypothetical protein
VSSARICNLRDFDIRDISKGRATCSGIAGVLVKAGHVPVPSSRSVPKARRLHKLLRHGEGLLE